MPVFSLSLTQLQVLLPLLSALSLLSAAWLVLHARDVVLLLRQAFPLEPGQGRRLASFKAVSAVLTLFGFSLAGEMLIIAQVALG
ncbi:hypothetical protein [Erythrobacter sp.]|uniref:hypothetical protein n=1 Tax=Erythrobacter sp. TaxID=1042 RepID=UPI0025EC11EA|nr:hypothetical protein [Erythrobacter sp.]